MRRDRPTIIAREGMGWEEPPIQSDPRRRCTCVRACGAVRGKNQEPPNRKWSLGFLGIVDCGFALLCEDWDLRLETWYWGVREGKNKIKEGHFWALFALAFPFSWGCGNSQVRDKICTVSLPLLLLVCPSVSTCVSARGDVLPRKRLSIDVGLRYV